MIEATQGMIESLAKWRDRPRPEIEEPLKHWGGAVYGDVLEVGLGMGHLAAQIAANPRVTSHTIIEVDPQFLPNAPPSAEVIIGEWPCPMGRKFDCITLDFYRFDFNVFRASLSHLNNGGAIFVRTM